MKKVVIAVVCSAVLSGLAVLAWTALSQASKPAAAGDSILSIPACAFNELKDGYDFFRSAVLNFSTGTGNFCAPVNLPNGSVIKKIILICYDHGVSNISLVLIRSSQTFGYLEIATVSSSGSSINWTTYSQRLTSNKYVNTWKFAYYLNLYLPGSGTNGYKFDQAKIIYTPPSP